MLFNVIINVSRQNLFKPFNIFKTYKDLIKSASFKPIQNFHTRPQSKIKVFQKRFIKTRQSQNFKKRFRSITLYIAAAGIFMIGATYAGVPLYRIYCQVTS